MLRPIPNSPAANSAANDDVNPDGRDSRKETLSATSTTEYNQMRASSPSLQALTPGPTPEETKKQEEALTSTSSNKPGMAPR